MTGPGGYLDSEWTAFSAVSAVALLGAGIGAARIVERRRGSRDSDLLVAPALLFVVLAAMAADELLEVHERVADWFGASANAVFVPAVAIALFAYLGTLRSVRGDSRALLRAGGVLWAASQVCELVANSHYGFGLARSLLVFPEEFGELAGSICIGAGLWLAPQSIVRTMRKRASPAIILS